MWNDENRLVSASNAEVVVTYAYDHRGRMIRKTVSGPPQKEVGMGSKPGWNKWKKGKSTTIPGPISFYPSNPLNPLWRGGRL